MLNKNSLGLLKKALPSKVESSFAWHLRWLVRTKADISLRPQYQSLYNLPNPTVCNLKSVLVLMNAFGINLISVLGLTNPLGRKLISAFVLTSHLKCQAKLLILLTFLGCEPRAVFAYIFYIYRHLMVIILEINFN